MRRPAVKSGGITQVALGDKMLGAGTIEEEKARS